MDQKLRFKLSHMETPNPVSHFPALLIQQNNLIRNTHAPKDAVYQATKAMGGEMEAS